MAERAAEIVVRFRREAIVTRLAEHVALHVAMLVGSVRYLVERQVRDRSQFGGEFFVRGLRRQFEFRHRGLELGDFGHQLRGARLIPGLLGIAYFFRGRVAPCLRLFGSQDRRTASFVDRKQRGRKRRQTAALQAGVKGCRVVSDRFDVVHGRSVLKSLSEKRCKLTFAARIHYHTRHRPRRRAIQYSRNVADQSRGRGVLDTPLSRGMTASPPYSAGLASGGGGVAGGGA